MVIEAIYDNGVLRLLTPVPFADQERVKLTVIDDDDEEELFDRDYARHYSKPVDPTITHEEVRKALSTIKGSMDEAIDEIRGEW